jgi:hypothetical protein
MCLKNVRLGYGILPKYDNATAAWNNTEQHRDRNVPLGVDVPLYYSWGRDGHINVRLANGRVWSDGDLYVSIEDYEAKKEPNFLGWGESVNEVRVIQHVADPVPPAPKYDMPKVNTTIQLIPKDSRTVYHPGSSVASGRIEVTDNSFIYTVRYVRDNRIGIYTKSGGSQHGTDYKDLALYFTNGTKIPGWVKL